MIISSINRITTVFDWLYEFFLNNCSRDIIIIVVFRKHSAKKLKRMNLCFLATKRKGEIKGLLEFMEKAFFLFKSRELIYFKF